MSGDGPPTGSGVDELSTAEAFAALGNETRLAIIRVLWTSDTVQRYDGPDEHSSALPDAELRDATGVDDNGNFNYHLEKLRPHLVTKTDAGYRLTNAGRKLARAVVAVSNDSPGFRRELDSGVSVL